MIGQPNNSTDSSNCDISRHNNSGNPDTPAIRVTLEPLPVPPDMAKRLARIYALALRRAREAAQQRESGDK